MASSISSSDGLDWVSWGDINTGRMGLLLWRWKRHGHPRDLLFRRGLCPLALVLGWGCTAIAGRLVPRLGAAGVDIPRWVSRGALLLGQSELLALKRLALVRAHLGSCLCFHPRAELFEFQETFTKTLRVLAELVRRR